MTTPRRLEGRLTSAAAGRIGPFAVPAPVREVIGRRLERLSVECNQVLTVGAVVGRHFGVELLQRVAQLPRAQILELLDEAAAARVVVVASDAFAAHEDAATYYERALSLVALQDEADEHDRGEMLLALARARRCAGQVEEERATAVQAATPNRRSRIIRPRRVGKRRRPANGRPA